MPLACLVYIAEKQSKSCHAKLLEYKDHNTRLYARDRITGVLVVAGGFFFEIMEGQYATLEANLDRVSAGGIMKTPDILIFSALKKRQFQSWKMGIINTTTPRSTDLTVYHVLGDQTQSDARSTPVAAVHMLKRFHEQFANQSLHSGAA